MDKSTYEVRKQYWSGIIAQCHARPEGKSAKQWLEENGIRESTYYVWQRRIRQDMYEQFKPCEERDTANKTLPAKRPSEEIVFAELPHPVESHLAEENFPNTNIRANISAAATVAAGNVLIHVAHDITPGLLEVILREVLHA